MLRAIVPVSFTEFYFELLLSDAAGSDATLAGYGEGKRPIKGINCIHLVSEQGETLKDMS